jgi:hypothetical protein
MYNFGNEVNVYLENEITDTIGNDWRKWLDWEYFKKGMEIENVSEDTKNFMKMI